jgi:hypothetical protein
MQSMRLASLLYSYHHNMYKNPVLLFKHLCFQLHRTRVSYITMLRVDVYAALFDLPPASPCRDAAQ